ncbi:MAG: MAPEG family protein [Methylovulum sp.]|nr:MAPEG family protein [Methylovulum sp.]
MNPNLIIFPVFAIVLLTFAVGILMLKCRFKAVKEDGLNRSYFLLNKGARLPDYLAKVTNHYANLFELPVLFYVLCLIIYSGNHTDLPYTVLAWCFVISRYAHAYIHIGDNNVTHRMLAFLGGTLILAVMWIRLAVQLLG